MQVEMPVIEDSNKRPVQMSNKSDGELQAPSSKAPKTTATAVFDGVRKSDVDKCQYRVVTLSNQLQVLLVHEPGLDKASAAMDVHVGSFSDPADIPGVAHFLEHLLFMGTDKYPAENDYMEFLAAHGGNSNAFTDDEHTNYFFEVSAEHFEPALDRFAQFFVAPLFNPDGTSREMQAVDSEHKKNLKDDQWRVHQLERTLSRPDHPYSKFGTGCRESLDRPGIRDVIVDFYKHHYSANIMKAVLYGKEPLEQLARWAEEKFSAIPNKALAVPSYPDCPWTDVQKLIKMKAVKEMQTLYVSWQAGDIRKHNRSKPDIYISHLFGHEGRGSLLSFLKSKNLVLGLSAGFDDTFHGFSFFQISFELTPVGRESVHEIIEACYQYIALLKTSGPQKWIHDECAALSEMTFRFKDKTQSSSSHAYKLASQMQEYPLERIISGPYLIEEWDPEAIRAIVDGLNVDNFRAALVYSGFKPDASWAKERWYGTHYQVQDLDAALLARCSRLARNDNPDLRLPQPNQFIPSKFEFVGRLAAPGEPKRQPDRISASLWFKQDDQFALPKSSYHVLFKTPLVFDSPVASASAGLYVECLKIALTEVTYDAVLAGLSFDVQSVADGFEVRVHGFSEKAPVLLETIARHLASFALDPVTFASVKDRFVRQLKSLKEEKPVWHAGYYAGCILQERMLHWKDKLAAAQNIDQQSVFEFGAKAVKSCTLLVLVDGNESEEGARAVERRLTDAVQPSNSFPEHTTLRSVRVPVGEHVFYDPSPVANPNSAIDFYLQTGTLEQARQRQSAQLFAQIFSEQFFDQLRTKEQLGYMVYQQVREKGVTIGLRMAVQSEKDPVYLEGRIEAFLDGVVDKLEGMSGEEFGKYQRSLVSDLTAKKKKLTQESKEFWAQISGFRHDFAKHFVDAKGVAELSKADLVHFAKQCVVKDAPERRKLAVHIWSDSKADLIDKVYANCSVIRDIGKFVGEQCELLDVSYKIPQ